MPGKYFHIGFSFRGEPGTQLDPLQKAIEAGSVDWVRYGMHCWVVYSPGTPEQWTDYLRKTVHNDDYIFICELNLANKAGWLPQFVWEWLNRTRY